MVPQGPACLRAVMEVGLYLEVHNGEAEPLGFPHNCGEILQVGRQESSEGGQQSCIPGLLEALEVSSDVPGHRCVQSNQVQLQRGRQCS